MSNSADKRSVTTDALLTLGTIHQEQQYRDAIHLGVEPVIAGEPLGVGEHIGIGPDGRAYNAGSWNVNSLGVKPVGIVDPFLDATVHEGEKFWLVVYPRQITSLHHVWEHPDFPKSTAPDISELPNEVLMKEVQKRLAYPEVQEAKPVIQVQEVKEERKSLDELEQEEKSNAFRWIDNYADGLGLHTDTLLDYADEWVEYNGNGQYLIQGGLLEGESVSSEFWDNYSIYRGITLNSNQRSNFFSCSC